VWFASDREKLYLVPVTGSDSAWYKNVLETPSIRVAAAGVHLDATATPSRIGPQSSRSSTCSGLRTRSRYRGLLPKHDAAVEIPLA
jgi:hypothetical protein